MIEANANNINLPVRHIKGKVELYGTKSINYFDRLTASPMSVNMDIEFLTDSFTASLIDINDSYGRAVLMIDLPVGKYTMSFDLEADTDNTNAFIEILIPDIGLDKALTVGSYSFNVDSFSMLMIHTSGVDYELGNTKFYFNNFKITTIESELVNTFSYTDNLKEFSIERAAESKFFGYGVCQKLNVKLRDINREINTTTDNFLKVYLTADNDFVNIGADFYITENHRDENTNELSITAYDAIKTAEKHTVSEIELSRYNISDFAAACAGLLGLELETQGIRDASFHTLYATGANFDGTETIREALNAVAEATQTIYFIAGGKLIFKRLGAETNLTITKADYITLDSKDNRRLTTIVSANELGDNVSATTGATGSTQFVRNNPFWELREDIAELLENAVAAVGNLTINQFNCNWRGNYLLEIGDKIELITKDNEQVTSYMLNDTLIYNGALSQQTSWSYTDNDNETASNPNNLGEALKQTFARVDKANKQIDIVASETNANTSAIAALQINTDSINASVMKIEEATASAIESTKDELTQLTNKVNAQMTAEQVILQIESELAKGATKVITTTGFTFDESGLNVSNSNSEMNTQISENGMQVFKNDTAVLTANNIGVDAVNLHATTYLIIGNNSRFEDYGERTACFWVGGNS